MPVITGGSTPVTFTVEVCFNQDPNDPAPPTAVWTDITQRCSNIRWSRGRQYELDKVEAGTFSATVDNLDGALTPGNTSSAFYPNVVLYRQIRVKAVLASTTYYLFTGYVSRWPQAYTAAGQRASTAIEAVDALGVLAQVNLKGWGNSALLAYNPTVVYPLDDGTAATLFNASVGAFGPGSVTGSAALVQPGQQFDAAMPGFSGLTYTTFTNPVDTPGGSVISFPPSALVSGAWTASVWFRSPPNGSKAMALLSLTDGRDTGGGVRTAFADLYVSVTGNLYAGGYDSTTSTGFNVLSSSSLFPLDSRWHLASISLSSDFKSVRVVIDDNPVQTFTNASPMTSLIGLTTLRVGGFYSVGTYSLFEDTGTLTSPFKAYYAGDLANVAIFPGDLPGDTVNNPCQTVLYPAGTTAFLGERTDQRAQRIAAVAGFGSRFVATANGDSLMSAGATDGQTAADALSDVASTEFGMIFGRGDGMLVSTPRHARYNPSPVYLFGELELPYSSLAFDYDPTHLVNQATVDRPGGTSTTVTDAASVKTNFTHSQSYTLQVSTDLAVRAAAEWIVSRYKDPKIRVSSFTVNPLANSDLVSAVLNLELNTCVQVNRRPAGAQKITQTCFVDRLEHQLTFDSSGGSWTVDYTLTPADTTNYMVWDAPSPFGNWDQNNWGY